ncbi:hypothetical protein OEZ85_002485 [Tetradesmus obliquus]|uniref:tRNA:m(4)X modification enzyme TRM13 n=1 Tax=Tetradesmus obliquus TaxID=3088 RepID=A0ABY8TXN0_TETOB|nr:hypothetical protein OEZ85_002485 [Tetradesmus obliquus]
MSGKKRLCNWPCKPGQRYCGNHLFSVTGGGEARVPCPANPNHDVPASLLQQHIRKCPAAIQAAAARAQPYFCENLNTGAVDPQQALLQLQQRQLTLQQQQQQQRRQRQREQNTDRSSSSGSSSSRSKGPLCFELPSEEAARVSAEASASFLGGNADRRQAAAIQHGPAWFAKFVTKVEAAHAALSAGFPSSQRVLGGADGDVAALFEFSRRLDPLMPFDAKHAAQHASLVGNMQAAGLLQQPTSTVFLELGAGKGFLSAWLHQVCNAQDVILLDRMGNFAKKADRRLRHIRLTRVAVDLKDAALLPLLQLHTLDYHPADLLSRQQRISFGLKCKQLLDMGRCGWIHSALLPAIQQQQQQQQQQGGEGVAGGDSGLDVRPVAYIDASVTGENTLLLVGRVGSSSS